MSSLFSCLSARKPQPERSPSQSSDLNEKTTAAITNTRAWEAALPQPTDDAIIAAKVTAVFDQIDAFAAAHYREKTTLDLDAGHEACLTLVGTPHLPASPFSLFQSDGPSPLICRPSSLIKHCLAYMIQQAMTMDEGGRNSLLPPYATALPQALRGTDHGDKPAFDDAFAHWRVLTAYLQPASEPHAAKASRSAAIRSMADRVTGAFAPWESSPGSPEQRAAFVAICEAAADAGALMFAQPATFAWLWEAEDLAEDEVPRKVAVVRPGLVKVGRDAMGERRDVVVRPVHTGLGFPVGYTAV